MTMNDDELNRAIDDVARDMVGAEPPVSLRASVMARLEGDTPGLGVGFPRWARAAAMTAVIAAAVGTWLAMPTHQPQPEGLFVNVVAPAVPPPDVPSGAPPVATSFPVAAGTAAPVAARLRKPLPRLEHGLAWEAGPEPLPGPEPITIDALPPDVLNVPNITVAPMDEIQPLTIPPAGPGLPDPQRRDRE